MPADLTPGHLMDLHAALRDFLQDHPADPRHCTERWYHRKIKQASDALLALANEKNGATE